MTCPVCDASVSNDTLTCPTCQADLTEVTISVDRDAAPPPAARRPAWLLFGGVAVVVLALGAAAMAFVDNTGADDANYADRIPAGAAAYFEIDVAALTSEETKSIIDAFGPLVEAQTGDPFDIESLLEETVASLTEELGDLDLSFRDDIASWATGPVGVGLYPVSTTESGATIVVGGNDADALDAFLSKVAAVEDTDPVEVGGVTFHVVSRPGDGQILMGRQGTDLLAASDRALAVRLAEPTPGDTMADVAGFRQAVDALPAGAVVVFAVDPEAAEAFGGFANPWAVDGMAGGLTVGSVSTQGANLRIDYATERGNLPAPSFEPTLAAALPAETIAFFRVGPVIDQYAPLAESPMFEGMIDDWENELGFSIDDFLAVFSVDGAVAVWPSTDILLPLNAALVGVSDRNQAPLVEQVVGLVESMGLLVSPIEGGYSFEGVAHLGTRDNFTFLTTQRSLIADAPATGFDSSDIYRRARELVDGELVGLIDVPAVLGLVESLVAADDPEIAEMLSCLPIGLVAAGSASDGTLVSTSVVVEVTARC